MSQQSVGSACGAWLGMRRSSHRRRSSRPSMMASHSGQCSRRRPDALTRLEGLVKADEEWSTGWRQP
jgi:hypothetical protein